jgi:inhibitor of cysteine peptidase
LIVKLSSDTIKVDLKGGSLMKTNVFQIGMALVLLLGLLACSSPAPVTQSLTSGDAGKVVNAAAGSELTLTLESNVTTGYSWTENAAISNGTVLKQTSHEYQPPVQAIPGRGGQEVWTFKMLAAGTAVVSMEYKRPFEPNNPPANTFNVTVMVK